MAKARFKLSDVTVEVRHGDTIYGHAYVDTGLGYGDYIPFMVEQKTGPRTGKISFLFAHGLLDAEKPIVSWACREAIRHNTIRGW